MSKQGFTLVELLIVVIVIGILVAISVPNYMRTVERSKAGKAKHNLLAIKDTQVWYRAHNDEFCDDITLLLDWGLPLESITSDQDWIYTVPVYGAIDLEIMAERTNGPYTGESISLDENGHLTTTAPAAPWDIK